MLDVAPPMETRAVSSAPARNAVPGLTARNASSSNATLNAPSPLGNVPSTSNASSESIRAVGESIVIPATETSGDSVVSRASTAAGPYTGNPPAASARAAPGLALPPRPATPLSRAETDDTSAQSSSPSSE